MAKRKDKLDEAMSAVEALFSDTSVSPSVTLSSMEEIQERVAEYIQLLRHDITRAQRSKG